MDADDTQAKVLELYQSGCGYTKIAAQLGIPRTTVRRILDKAGGSTAKAPRPAQTHVHVPINKIQLHGNTQMRTNIKTDVVADYTEAMQQGDEFPPVNVFFDGTDYWLADGFHRVFAAIDAGKETISANVYDGTLRDARLHSMGANALHGLRRTNADKRRAVNMALEDEEWGELPNTRIAQICAVAESFVRKIKTENEPSAASDTPRFVWKPTPADAPEVAPRITENESAPHEQETAPPPQTTAADIPSVAPEPLALCDPQPSDKDTGTSKADFGWGNISFDTQSGVLSLTLSNGTAYFKNKYDLQHFMVTLAMTADGLGLS